MAQFHPRCGHGISLSENGTVATEYDGTVFSGQQIVQNGPLGIRVWEADLPKFVNTLW